MITEAISSGIAYLLSQQQKDGSFPSLASSTQTFRNAYTAHSTFSTSLILSCLHAVRGHADVAVMKKKAIHFLLKQKSADWSYNYWSRDAEEAQKMPYPDDLDDTFCALSALFLSDPTLLDGAAFAKIVMLLTSTETQEGGPYRTWLVPQDADPVWKDVDIAVNSNIAYFLSLQEIELPPLAQYIDDCIETKRLTSPYYPSIYPILYFLSRFYKGRQSNYLQDILWKKYKKDSYWGTPLHTALAITTLLRFGYPVQALESAVVSLAKQQKSSSWQAYPFYIGATLKRKKRYYAGSAALTAAFCIEALENYAHSAESRKAIVTKISTKEVSLKKTILTRVEKHFQSLPTELGEEGLSIVDKIVKRDTQNEISLMPYRFRQALGENGNAISDAMLVSLGEATLYGWIAYTIYDHIIDHAETPQNLPVANVSLRALTMLFLQTVPRKDFKTLFTSIMDDIDAANSWEMRHCRIPFSDEIQLSKLALPQFGNYTQIANKSFGHALGPLALLFSMGYGKSSDEVKQLSAFFKHYIIARQLNDDAHDWEEDLKKGQLNPVSTLLIKTFMTEQDSHALTSLEQMLPQLQKLFWSTTLDTVCQKIQRHIRLAHESLLAIPLIEHPEIFRQVLDPIAQATIKALAERDQTRAFLTTYRD